MMVEEVNQCKTKDDGTVKVVSVPPGRTVQSFVCMDVQCSVARIRVGYTKQGPGGRQGLAWPVLLLSCPLLSGSRKAKAGLRALLKSRVVTQATWGGENKQEYECPTSLICFCGW